MQQMNLITVRYGNILSLSVKTNRTPLTKETLMTQYSDIFQGTGKFEEPYKLAVEPDSVPVVHPSRPVPHALKEELKEELDRLEAEGILKAVVEPTPWVSSMVVVRKPNGKFVTFVSIQKI